MIKKNLKFIFGLLVGILIGSVSVYAITVKSNNVSFSPEDSEWNVSNVSDALNDLNELSNKTSVYYLGKGTSFNIKTLLPDIDYTKLTADNFIVGVSNLNSLNISTSSAKNDLNNYAWLGLGGNTISKSYNDGVLTISGNNSSYYLALCATEAGGGYGGHINVSNLWHTTFAYLVLGNIENA